MLGEETFKVLQKKAVELSPFAELSTFVNPSPTQQGYVLPLQTVHDPDQLAFEEAN